jgi:hypothetical protein
VSNEKVRVILVVLQAHEEVEDLGLYRNIERRDRFVTDDKSRSDNKGPRDGYTLSLPARKLVRVAPEVVEGVETDTIECLGRSLAPNTPATHPHVDQALGDDRLDRHTRVEGSVGVLENDLHLPAQGAQTRRRCGRNGLPIETHLACGRFHEAQHAPPQSRLATSGLADKTERLSLANRERNPIHGLHLPDDPLEETAVNGKVFHQVLDLQERRRLRVAAAFTPTHELGDLSFVLIPTPISISRHGSR